MHVILCVLGQFVEEFIGSFVSSLSFLDFDPMQTMIVFCEKMQIKAEMCLFMVAALLSPAAAVFVILKMTTTPVAGDRRQSRSLSFPFQKPVTVPVNN